MDQLGHKQDLSRIADLKMKVAQLQEKNELMLDVLNNVSDIVYLVDLSGNIKFIGDSIRVYGFDPQELLGKPILNIIHPDDRADAEYIAKEKRRGERRTIDKRLRLSQNGKHPLPIGVKHRVFLFTSEGVYKKDKAENTYFAGTHGIARDVTDHESVKLELIEARDRLQTILDTVPGHVSWISSDLKYLGVNKSLAAQFGKLPNEFLGFYTGFQSKTNQFESIIKDFFKSNNSCFKQEITLEQDIQYLFTGQKYNNDKAAVFVSIDISKLKKAEARIQTVLTEKVELLQEVHHRVNNNVQILMSLLDMQISSGYSAENLKYFMTLICRIWTMLRVHEQICRDPNAKKIPFSEYLSSLFNFYISGNFLDPAKISVNLEVEVSEIDVTQHVPLSMIVNELICNSLQHAFHDSKQGCLNIKLSKINEGKLVLIVSDDGTGIPVDIDISAYETIGLSLIHSLADQLGGTIQWKRNKGTQFQLEFPSTLHDDIDQLKN